MKEKLIKRLAGYLLPYAARFAAGQIFMLLSLGGSIVLPLIIRDLLDFARPLPASLAILGIITLISGLANFFKDILLGRVSNAITVDLRTNLYETLQGKSLAYYHRNNSGDIVSSMTNDINIFQQSLSTGITWLLQMFLSFFTIVTILFIMDWTLSLILLVSFPLIILLTRILGRPVRKASLRAQEELSRVTGSLNQTVTGISVIKSFTLESYAARLFRGQNDSWFRHMTDQIRIKARTGMLVHFLNMGQIILMLGLGAWRISRGEMTVGALTAFIMYAQALASPMGMLSQLYVDVQKSLAAAGRVFRLMDEEEALEEPAGGGDH